MRTRWFWVGLAVGVAFLALAASRTDVAAQAHVLASIRPTGWAWLALTVALHVVHLTVRTARWRFLFAPPRPPMRRLFSALTIGYLFNNLVARSGEIVRMGIVGRWLPALGFGGIAVTITAERLVDVVQVLTLAAVVALASPFSPLALGGSAEALAAIVAIAATAVVSLVLAVRNADRVERGVRLVLTHLPARLATGPLSSFAAGGVAGLRGLSGTGPHGLLGVLAAGACDFTVAVTAYRITAFAVDRHPSMMEASFILVASGLGAMVPSGPGNVGTLVFCVTLAAERTAVGDRALAYAVALFAVHYLVRCTLGAVALALETRHTRRLDLAPARASRASTTSPTADFR